jgi:membrane protein YdbS with pleckstrin-like domain
VPDKIFKPALKGSWVLLFGALLGPIIVITGRHRDGAIWPWVFLTTVFVALFLHRLSLRYTISDSKLTTQSWWSLGQPEEISLSAIDRVEIVRSFSMRLVDCAHIIVHSAFSAEGSLTLLAQSQAEQLADELKKHSNYLKTDSLAEDLD